MREPFDLCHFGYLQKEKESCHLICLRSQRHAKWPLAEQLILHCEDDS